MAENPLNDNLTAQKHDMVQSSLLLTVIEEPKE